MSFSLSAFFYFQFFKLPIRILAEQHNWSHSAIFPHRSPLAAGRSPKEANIITRHSIIKTYSPRLLQGQELQAYWFPHSQGWVCGGARKITNVVPDLTDFKVCIFHSLNLITILYFVNLFFFHMFTLLTYAVGVNFVLCAPLIINLTLFL